MSAGIVIKDINRHSVFLDDHVEVTVGAQRIIYNGVVIGITKKNVLVRYDRGYGRATERRFKVEEQSTLTESGADYTVQYVVDGVIFQYSLDVSSEIAEAIIEEVEATSSATVSVIREDGTYTAVKRNGRVIVLHEDGTVAQEFGGNRATRATAVLLAGWADEDFTRFLGCRADFEAAEKEAARLVRGTKRITNPAAWAIALPVTEEEGVVVSASAKSNSNLFKCAHPRCGLRIAVEYSTSGSDLGRWAHLNTVAGIEADKDHAAVPPSSRPSNKYNGQVRCACGCKYWGEDDLCVDCGADILNFSPQINAIVNGTEAPDSRVALVALNERSSPEQELARVRAYLPRNYVAYLSAVAGGIRISGYDNAGWTLQDYVIPRLASGLIFAKEEVA